MSKRISILGSTGSIGVNTLKVVKNLEGQLQTICLTANKNADLLIEQAKQFQPESVVIGDESQYQTVKRELSPAIEVLCGRDGLLEVSARKNVDLVMNGLVGSAGMLPTINSLKSGIDVALSNKESLVMAGSIIEKIKRETQAKIIPVDSEHSAIWQCLVGENLNDIKRIIITGSGGPFRTRATDTFDTITPNEALKHPNWSMGNKITIDSATMMNKGLEVIEAHWLFELSENQISIIVHPQSIIHSMVEFVDGSIKAQLGIPDMKIPIQYAVTYPRHEGGTWPGLDLLEIRQLTFEEPDLHKFPCIQLAYDALKIGGSAPAVLNVANEYAVYQFLAGNIRFTDIPRIVYKACEKHNWLPSPTIDDIIQLEQWAINFVNEIKIG